MQTYTHLELLDTTRAVESLPIIHKQKDHHKRLTGTVGRDSGFEVGAQIGVLRQANAVTNSHPLTRQASMAPMDNPRKTPVKKEQKQPLSFTDKGCHKAGDESRTHNIQLGRLNGINSKHLEILVDTNQDFNGVSKLVPIENKVDSESLCNVMTGEGKKILSSPKNTLPKLTKPPVRTSDWL